MSMVVSQAFYELMELLFGCVPVNVSEHYVTRKDYKAAMHQVQEKYNLQEGHPDYLEWILTIVGRSPKFVDSTTQQRQTVCPLPDEWKPQYTKDLIEKLKQPGFCRISGMWILGILRSSMFWNKLCRRLDMIAFALVQTYDHANLFTPKEMDASTADMLFTVGVEWDLLQLKPDMIYFWIADELFRIIVLDQKVELVEEVDLNYVYFTAPYFNSFVYDPKYDVGQVWMDDLAKKLFKEPLEQLIGQINQTIN